MSNLAVANDFVEKKVEIINGREYLMAAPALNHTTITGNIFASFHAYLKDKDCRPFASDADVHLSENDTFRPDVLVVCDEDKIRDDAIYGAPDLVVEILSPSTSRRDKGIKRDAYEKFGVREYWIVDPMHKSLEIYELVNGKYKLYEYVSFFSAEELERLNADDRASVVSSFSPVIFPEMVINTVDIFRNVK